MKYQVPAMDALVDFESDVATETIGVFVRDALEGIKEVPTK